MNTERNRDQEALRELLRFFVDKMDATQVELSTGMGISRPLVNEFLNSNKDKLPVEREHLIKLCKYLYSNEAGSRRKSKRNDNPISEGIGHTPTPIELRKLLKDIGADELLEAAGLLPDINKSIRVSNEHFPQIAKIIAMLEILKREDVLSVTQEILKIVSNKLAADSRKLFKQDFQHQEEVDSLSYLINKLLNFPSSLGLKQRLDVIEKLRRSRDKLGAGGKTNFSQQEAIALFLSILTKNQMFEEAINYHIRVQKVEFQTLSKSVEKENAYSDIYDKLVEIGYQAERDLETPASSVKTSSRIQSLEFLNPVLLAIVTCSFSYNENPVEILELTYTSNGTMLENAISAISLLMGITKEIDNAMLSIKALDGNINALVETTVILKDHIDDQQYHGIWVDRDLFITALQSIVCAAKQWLTIKSLNNEIDLEVYDSECKLLSGLRKRLSKARKAFQNFQFIDSDIDDINLISELSDISLIARSELKKIPSNKIYFSLRLNLYRCYFLAKLKLLRLANFQGNLSKVKSLLEEVEEMFAEDITIKEELIPILVLIRVEIHLYKLSCGHVSELLFNSTERQGWLNLKEQEKTIIEGMKRSSFYKDPGMDIYHALSEIHGNTARMEFYLSDDRYVLEESVDYFLKAAHYALRIGLTQRASRWLALAGRLYIRLGDDKLAFQTYKLASKLASSDLTAGHSNQFREAIYSEINLLHGEYFLSFKDNASDALEKFLISLKGASYLGLSRRICDALFNIYRCSTNLSDLSIKEGLSRVFKGDMQLTDANSDKLNPGGNHTSEQALSLLYDLWSESGNSNFYLERERFRKLAVAIWQGWHESSSEARVSTEHPVVRRIKSGLWLRRV